jgi:hypothetical protein
MDWIHSPLITLPHLSARLAPARLWSGQERDECTGLHVAKHPLNRCIFGELLQSEVQCFRPLPAGSPPGFPLQDRPSTVHAQIH